MDLSHTVPARFLFPGRPSADDFNNDPSGRLAFSQQLVATAQLTETLKVR